ncbi:unnamed protein product [Oikopleura dioica]|uniref:3-hydroxyisobutyrate dehydrogenase n=1 Tax=Oikopleura dioica TaxID=34765 RepID=E4Y0Q0_OIKDI|nr:unnamed protein product [Oikopleura dioica]
MLSQSARLLCVRNTSSLGFIGLGNMGGPMAMNLLNKAKGDLWVYDVNAESVDKAIKAGAKAASAPAEIAENCDRIVTMLPNSPHVMSTFGGDQGLLAAAKAGTLFLDCSTIDPAAAQTVSISIYENWVVCRENVSREGNSLHGCTCLWWCWSRCCWHVNFHGWWPSRRV